MFEAHDLVHPVFDSDAIESQHDLSRPLAARDEQMDPLEKSHCCGRNFYFFCDQVPGYISSMASLKSMSMT